MTLLVALVIAALGIALIGFAILALRDDAPQWTLRVKRPGWVGFLGVIALLVALIVNASRQSIADDVSDAVGREASCEKIGVLVIRAERVDVHACQAAGGANLGCFGRVDGDLVDLTRQSQALGALQNRC